MKLAGQHKFDAPVEEVYERLLDPESLRRCMPGCERLEPQPDGRLAVVLAVPIPAVKGEYEGTIEIVDREPHSSFRMKIGVEGKSGFVNADALMRLEADGEAGSIVNYEADAQVGGPVASVGQRMLTGISRRQVDQMLRCLDRGAPRPGLWARIADWFRRIFRRRSE